jgi:transcription antitermination factor NusG
MILDLDTPADLCESVVITGSVPLDMELMPCASHPVPVQRLKLGSTGRVPSSDVRRILKHPEPIADAVAPGVRWYCVRTDYGHEITADFEIRRLGLPVFLLQEFRPAKADRKGVVKAGCYDRIVPVFPRYLFTAFDITEPTWRHIASRRGVERIFGTGPERPTPIPQAAIDVLLLQCAPNGVIYPPEKAVKSGIPQFPGVEVGASVELLTGPFARFHGICLLSEPNRIKLLVEIFGRASEVEVRSATDVRVLA